MDEPKRQEQCGRNFGMSDRRATRGAAITA
jgi:hypothetical protein